MANEFKVKKGLIVDGSNTVLDIQGTAGQLFSVTDSLTGDLLSVSDVSGIPIFNVNSSGLSTFDGDVKVDGGEVEITSSDNDTILTIANTKSGGQTWKIHSASSSSAPAIAAGDFLIRNGSTNVLRLGGNGNYQANFAGNINVGGGQILTPGGVNLALNPNTGLVSVGGTITATGTGANKFTGGLVLGTPSNGNLVNKLTIASGTNGDGIFLTGLGNANGMGTGHYKSIDYQYSNTDSSFGSAIRFVTADSTVHGGQIEIWTDNSSGTITKALTLDKSQNATFEGEVTATEYNLPSGGMLDWANGDARIVEGLVNNYSLSLQTYDGTNVTTALRLDGDNTATFAGNLIGKSDHTTELGSYASGQIKRIRMSQGGEVVFGDSSTANPIGLTEGVWNNFSDQDYMSIYSRNSFRIYGYNTSASPAMHVFVGRHTSSGGNFMHIGGGTSPNGTYGASNTILTVKGATSGGEGIVQIVGLGNNATDNVGCLAFHSQAEADPMASIRSVRGSADDVGSLTFNTNNGGSESVALTLSNTNQATFTGDVTIGGNTGSSGNALAVNRGSDGSQAMRIQNSGEVVIPSNYLYCNAGGTSLYVQNTAVFRGSIINDGGNVTIADTVVITGTNDLRIDNGSLTSSQSSTTAPVARFTDAGVANYDWTFPDSSTIQLNPGTSSTKTFKLHNSGSGGFNIHASSATFDDNTSATGSTILDVQGTEGQLFSVTNSLSGDLFSVADISGVPILNVNSSGLIEIDGETTATGDITINKDAAKLILQDTGTGGALNTWVSYTDGNGTERAYVGYGSASNSIFYVVNNLGDLRFHAGGVHNSSMSSTATTFEKTAIFNGDMTLPAAADHFLIGAGSLQTTSKIKFGLPSWNNSLGLESYWMVLRTNQNEGLKLIDSGGNVYVQFNAGNSGSPANKSTFLGQIQADNFTSTGSTANIFLGSLISKPSGNSQGFILRNSTNAIIGQLKRTSDSGSQLTCTTIEATSNIYTSAGTIGNLNTSSDIGQQLEPGNADVATLRCDANRWRVYMGGAGNSQETLTVNESGNVGIKDGTPSYRLDVAGTIRATGDVIAYSDERVKENINTIDNSLEKVNKLRGVEFNKIGEDKKSIGVIAQEIEKILPEVVRTDDKGMKSVAYGNIVGVLIEAVKELTTEVEQLKKEINGGTR